MTSIARASIATAATLALAACASMPQSLQGTFTAINETAATQSGAPGTPVRWGGQIVKTEPGEQATCFFVLARPLDSIARPRIDANSGGRFVACHAGFYDPEVYARGREVTFTGTLAGSMQRKIGKYDYTYPRIEANTVYLWPKRIPIVYRDPFYDPFWGPTYNPWYNPYWMRPPVIIVRPPVHSHPHK